MAASMLSSPLQSFLSCFTALLDERSAWRLEPLVHGMLQSRGRQTVTAWLRASEHANDFRQFYHFLSTLGRTSSTLFAELQRQVFTHLPPTGRIILPLDDSPTKRSGPKVQGAGYHHNPTPGPTGSPLLYGHNWVTLSYAATHPQWGTIALPLAGKLYVTQKAHDQLDPDLQQQHPFRTKLTLATELLEEVAKTMENQTLPVWVVADGFYAKKEVADKARALQQTYVTRLRHDAALYELPNEPRKRTRGRPRKYGKQINLAKRAVHPKGWQTQTMTLYGQEQTKTVKRFEAIHRTLGHIVVVLVKETHGWVAFACTSVEATATDVLTAYAQRASVEQNYHDFKEVDGWGEQQVRRLDSNLGCMTLTLLKHAIVELWAWEHAEKMLTIRKQISPWDDPTRRPSHADRCRFLRRLLLDQELLQACSRLTNSRKIISRVRSLTQLAA